MVTPRPNIISVASGGTVRAGRALTFPLPIAPPALNATRAYAINTTTGRPYYLKNAVPSDTVPASLTKLMTACVLLQRKSAAQIASQTTTIVSADQVGGSGDNLVNGDVISLHSLLADAMLPSSNPACMAIARKLGQEMLNAETGGAGNPITRFVAEMNSVSASLGLSGSTWKNPHGIDESPNNATSPTDICKLLGLLWGYSTMQGIWGLGATYAMPVTRGGTPTTVMITSSVQMLGDTGVVGGKTGTTSSANLSILWRATNNQVVALCVINGGVDGRYADVRAMIARLPIDFPELA